MGNRFMIVLFLSIFSVVYVLGFVIGAFVGNYYAEKLAIHANVARYNPKDKSFEFITDRTEQTNQK